LGEGATFIVELPIIAEGKQKVAPESTMSVDSELQLDPSPEL